MLSGDRRCERSRALEEEMSALHVWDLRQYYKHMNPTSPLGRRRSREFPLPTPFFPFGEGFTPPLPPPLDLDGAPRERSERPRWPKTAPRALRRAQDELQDGSRQPTMRQDGSEDAPRGPKTVPRRLQEAKEPPKEASKKPKSFKNLKKSYDLCLLAFSLPMAIRGLKMAPRGPKRAPRGAQEGPKTAPRAPKSAPRAPQEGSKRRF